MNYLLTQTFGYLAITIILPIPHVLVCATNKHCVCRMGGEV